MGPPAKMAIFLTVFSLCKQQQEKPFQNKTPVPYMDMGSTSTNSRHLFLFWTSRLIVLQSSAVARKLYVFVLVALASFYPGDSRIGFFWRRYPEFFSVCAHIHSHAVLSQHLNFNYLLIDYGFPWLADVDECSASNPACNVNAYCNNTFGSYQCSCKTGFTGDGKTCTG